MRTVLLAAGTLACSLGTASAQLPPSALALVVATAESFNTDYVPRATLPADYVFFVDEPLRLRLAIMNFGDASETPVIEGVEGAQIFRVTATRDGVPVPLSLRFDAGMWKLFSGGRFHVEAFQPQRLEAAEGLEWLADISGVTLPGVYRLEFDARASDDRSRKVRLRVSRVTFELRPRTEAALPEILRRQAYRHFLADEFADAREAIARLLEVHPHSFVAHQLRSLVAAAEGNATEAQQARDEAARVHASGLDTLFHESGAIQ